MQQLLLHAKYGDYEYKVWRDAGGTFQGSRRPVDSLPDIPEESLSSFDELPLDVRGQALLNQGKVDLFNMAAD